MGHNPTLAVTTFRNVKEATGLQDFLDWETLSILLMHHTAYDRKEEGLLWSPTDYIAPDASHRVRRRATGVRRVSALVIDIDDGTPYSALPSALKSYEHIAHTTWQHHPFKPRYRIILPMRSAVPACDWKDFYAAALPLSGFHADPKCKDVCHIYYYPHHPFLATGFARRNEGALISAADFHLEMVRLREERQQKLDLRSDWRDTLPDEVRAGYEAGGT